MANEACDSCLIDQFGFLSSGSYPYSTAVESPDRVYCVDGVPVVPPSRGVIPPQVGFWRAQQVSSFAAGSGTISEADSRPVFWVNETARTMSFVVWVDGLLSGVGGVGPTVITPAVAVSTSGGTSVSASAGLYMPAGITEGGLPIGGSLSFSFCTAAAYTLAPGASVTVSGSASYSGATGTGEVLGYLSMNFTLSGGSS